MGVLLLLSLLTGAPCCTVPVRVQDSGQRPIAQAAVRAGEAQAQTDSAGLATLTFEKPGRYTIEASGHGLQTIRKEVDVEAGASTEVGFLLPPATVDKVTVEAQAPTDGSSATGAPVSGQQVKQLPTDPVSLREALPLIPGVVRSPEGRLRISGSPEYRSTLLVNSLDVTDPATGNFGATVPIDSVESFDVLKNPFLAEYGRFTAAVVIVDTKRGTDKWHFELNDPTPELRLRSGHIVGVRGFTPRIAFNGPLIRNKLYLSQSGEYRLNKSPVFTLPFPENETWRESWNSLTQFDYVASAKHALTVTLHLVPQKVNFANLSFYNPRPVTSSFRSREANVSIADHLQLGGGVLDSSFAANEITRRIWPQAGGELSLAPSANFGNYFTIQDRRARRYQWVEAFTVTKRAHTLKFGSSLAYSTLRGYNLPQPVNIVGAAGETLSRITWTSGSPYRVHDWDNGSYVQDHWQLRPTLAFDTGIRADWQSITGTMRLAPRAALTWAPFGTSNTVFRSGFGWFYDRVPLGAFAFHSYPQQVVDGNLLENRVGSRDGAGPFVFGSEQPGNFAPRSLAWSTQVEHRFPRWVRLRASYLENHSRGLLLLDPAGSALNLSDSGRSRYRQFEFISKLAPREGQEIMFSYVRSLSRGNLNEFGDFLGDSPWPVIRRDVYAVAPSDTPNRFLMWGVIPLNPRMRIAPVIEYRNGLPFSALNAAQQYAQTPNTLRFPNFFSLDFRIARDIHVRKHAVQVSFSMFNVTNHWNPDTVRVNRADPQFGEFLGQHRRRFRLDFDFLF